MTCAEHLKSWLDAIDGDEKFVMVMGCAMVNTVLFAAHTLSENGYLMILGGTIFAYISGKVYEDIRKQGTNDAQ